MNRKIILVTGGNRGIGLEICCQLAAAGHTVIMCSRDPEKGVKAATVAGIPARIFQLDVTYDESVAILAERVGSEFGRLDVLINNAGIGADPGNQARRIDHVLRNIAGRNYLKVRPALKTVRDFLGKKGILRGNDHLQNTGMEEIKRVMETNFYGPWRMINAFIPLLEKSDDGRIINLSSGMGQLSALDGKYAAYRISKSSLNALTILFANELKMKGIRVNAMCPGWVRTDMGGPDAPGSVSEGADTAVWLATEHDIPTGKFFRDRQVINW